VDEARGLVLFGDVVGSRRDPSAAAEWLRHLVDELDQAYGEQRLAPFGFTQGDELQGLLTADADPLVAVLYAGLSPAARPIRWVCVKGGVDTGEGPATQRTGRAFLAARDAIEAARAGHDRLVIRTGQAEADELLAGMTPALADLLEGLTPRQRAVARLALIGGLRQSEVADRLGVRRATISVSFGRARVQTLQRLVAAIRKVYSSASVQAGDGTGTGVEGRTS
jgi:DNA-binding CsgD family transcriptional regulator